MKKLLQKLSAPITAVPEPLQSSYFPALDGLRGLSILIVLLGHFGINKLIYKYRLLIDGDIGVHIFFVISGFLITTLLLKEKLRNGHISVRYFYIRRALRILPVAWLFLLFLVILNIVLRLHIFTLDFIQAVCFVKNFPIGSSYYTAHFWSLAVEEQFYLVFPVLLILSVDWYFFIALAVITIVPLGCVLGYYWPSFFGNLIWVKLCMYVFWRGPVVILIGSVFAICMFKNIIPLKKLCMNYWLGITLLFVAIIIRTPSFLYYAKYIAQYLSNILVAFVVVLALQPGTSLAKVLSSKLMVRIGILSYSLYIWQQLFVGSNPWQPWMHGLYGHPLWQLIILKLIATFLIAICSYAFERRFLKIKDRFKYKRIGDASHAQHVAALEA